MALKKIIKNAFEQVYESSRDMAKSSAKQVKETFSPWDMIRNSFTEGSTGPDKIANQKQKEWQGKGGNNTPLNFDKLQKSYENQDQKKIKAVELRLFQIVKKDEEKTLQRNQQAKAEKERTIAQEEAEKRRREEERKRQAAMTGAPEGKNERGTALSGKKKKRKATDPQPAETKPGGGKQ